MTPLTALKAIKFIILKQGYTPCFIFEVYMIDLYTCDISDLEINSEYTKRLTQDRADRLNRIRPVKNKKCCLGAGLLLDEFVIKGNKSSYKVSASGKPFMKNGPCFNISHSGNYVLLGVSDSEIGCDIEKMREDNYLRLAKFVFHPNEIDVLKSSDNQKDCFFTLWTKKEAFLKAVGLGFHRDSKEVDLSGGAYRENGREYFFRHYDTEDYKICVCSEQRDFPEKIKYVKY